MGYGIKQLKGAFSVPELLSGGIDLKAFQRDAAVKPNGAVTAAELKAAGVTVQALKDAGCVG